MSKKTRLISLSIIIFSMLLYNIIGIVLFSVFNINYYIKLFCFGINIPLLSTAFFAIYYNFRQATRWIICLSILCFVSILVYYFIIKYNLYQKFNSADKIKSFLSRYGIYASLIYIIIQFLQVTFIPLPAAITTMAGVALFGVWKTFFYSTIGIILGSIFAFYLGKKYGIKLFIWLFGEKLYKKYMRFCDGKDKIVLTMMFIFPFFPDDLLCIAAGMTNMTYMQFFILMSIIRPLNILAMEGAFKGLISIPLSGFGLVIWGIIIIIVLTMIILSFKLSHKIEGLCINMSNFISKKIRHNKKKDIQETYSQSNSCYDKNNIAIKKKA